MFRLLACVAVAAGLARAAEDPNWLSNPGFEDANGAQPAGWDLGMEGRGEGEAVWQAGGAHSGERCVWVRLTTAGDYYMARQRLEPPIQGGVLHQIRGWYRSDADMAAHPCVYYQTADRRFLGAWEKSLPKAEAWTPFQFTFVTPAGAERLELQLRIQGVIGTVWFDDVFVGPAAQLQAEREARVAAATRQLRSGPLALRALPPSLRPSLSELIDPGRFEAWAASREGVLSAARRERESLGVLVLGLGDGELRADVSDLKGAGGSILANEIKVRWADTVRAGTGAWPDPLLEAQPFKAPAGGVPYLWLTVHVPANARPGEYRGRLTARTATARAELPITLRVRDYALPDTPSLPTSFWMFRHTIRNFYGMETVPDDFYRQFLDLALEARLAPVDAAEWHDQPFVRMLRDAQGELQVDWPAWDPYLEYCFARGMSAFNVADDHWFGSYFSSFPVKDTATSVIRTVTLDRHTQEYADTVTRFFRVAREHFQAKGWAERAYLQGYDEPPADKPELLAEIKRFYELARQGWPGLRTLITAPPQSHLGLHGSIGVWCPLTPGYDDVAANARRAAGEEVWWYVCCGPTAPWSNFYLDQPAPSHRLLLWQTWQRKAQGLLYWGLNHWPGFDGRTMDPLPPDKRWPRVPWNDGGRNGDGYFIYPGPDGPLSSLRLEILRDGMEDYDALTLLAQQVKRVGERAPQALLERARRALEVMPRVYRTMVDQPADAGAMVERRREVDGLIETLAKVR
ncbi:MAG: DUF4091 domain-containing protein [Armatimonadetes bacterium]|nr:DUF4091 domain-containing protein [Armatimonadota bacterium]